MRHRVTRHVIFQFTPLREGRHSPEGRKAKLNSFQFTPLREGRPATLTTAARKLLFQFTPLREGRRCEERGSGNWQDISIHAPPRGATRVLDVPRCAYEISIHAPPRGATPLCDGVAVGGKYFNSRPSARGDAGCVGADGRQPDDFNSRPSARGDHAAGSPSACSGHFNSRPSARGDACQSAKIAKHEFQFTPLREGRPHPHQLQYSALAFQFTPLREGRRVLAREIICAEDISIHAPPRGATFLLCDTLAEWLPFQFTPLREGRPQDGAGGSASTDFNSRPSARGDSKRYAISANLLFNPYKSAWLNNNATQFVEIILVIFHRIIA